MIQLFMFVIYVFAILKVRSTACNLIQVEFGSHSWLITYVIRKGPGGKSACWKAAHGNFGRNSTTPLCSVWIDWGASSHSKRSQGMTGVWRSRLMLGRVAPSHYRLEHIDQIDSDCKFIWMEHVWKFDGLVGELPRHSYILKHHLFLVHLRYNSHKLQRFVALEARTVGWPQKYWHLNDPHCLGLAKGGKFWTKMEYKQTMLQS